VDVSGSESSTVAGFDVSDIVPSGYTAGTFLEVLRKTVSAVRVAGPRPGYLSVMLL
jgi:hypothetical protein